MTISERCICLTDEPQGFRRCPVCNGEGNLLISVDYIRPPIPTCQFDWAAVVDGQEEYGPYGHGATKDAAVADLMLRLEEAM
jgi:hypothetical protein